MGTLATMPEPQFTSAWFWENPTYEELHENEYHARRKKVNEDFLEFLNANLKELEFKKKKNYWQYTFEQDKNERIRVTEDNDGIHVFAMHQNEENEDIEEEIVDRDSGELFEKLMDRIMDALEVIECAIFDIETNTKTNVNRTPKQIKSGRLKMKKKLKKIKKKVDEDIDVYDPSDCDVESESIESTKRRSKRINKKSKKQKKERSESVDDEESETVSKRISVRSKNKKKRKREESISESENEEETEEIVVEKPKRKRRKVKNEKTDLREMKREFTRLWLDKSCVDAMHLAEDDYLMKRKEIDQWIEDMYDFDL